MIENKIKSILCYVPKKYALLISLGVMVALVLFHLLIQFRAIPFTLFWEGAAEMSNQMITYETSLVVADIVLALALSSQCGYLRFLRFAIPVWLIRNLMNVSCMLFAFNAMTDYYTADSLRDVLFATISLYMAFLTGSVIFQTNTSTTSTTL
jgi:hypothetical protein